MHVEAGHLSHVCVEGLVSVMKEGKIQQVELGREGGGGDGGGELAEESVTTPDQFFPS